jgi:polyphenol oxidase
MIKRIVPSVFDTSKVTVFFTESNRETVHTEHIIPGLDLGFNTRSDKKSVGQSYGLLAASLGKKELNVALAKQIHATAILEVKQAGNYPDTDGLITTVPGLGLGIRVADCAAVLVADTEKSVIGAFHAGWREQQVELFRKAWDK